MRIIICDRCRKRMTQAEKTGYVCLDWRDVKTGDLEGQQVDLSDWDLCDDCMAEIEQFVRMKPKKKTESSPEPAVEKGTTSEEPEPEKKKAGKEKACKKIDVGKIRALSEAGWPVKEIAADVGCSEVTVYKHIKTIKGDKDVSEESDRYLQGVRSTDHLDPHKEG